MAVPTINAFSIESLNFAPFDDHLTRWCSSSSLSTSSFTSRSTSSTGFTDCPTLSKSLTDSMSSDTQTENETPPESPNEDSHLQSTPVIHDTRQRSIGGLPCRPDLPAHLSIYSESGDDYDGSDAGYETECEGRQPMLRPKRSVKRRKALDRATFRRLGDLSYPRPASGAESRTLPGVHTIPSAPLLRSSPRIAGQSTSSSSRRGSISRLGGPDNITLPETSPPVFPSSGNKASIGLGLGIGLPSTLSAVRRAPNCVHRSSTDSIPTSMRSIVPVSPADLLLPLDHYPIPPTPLKPRLNPLFPSPVGELSPLDLASSSLDNVLHTLNDGAIAKDSAPPIQPRHAAFCFSHGTDWPTDLSTSTYGTTASAFLTIANHAQSQQNQSTGSGTRRRMPKGPPNRGSPLPPMQEEVCPGDEARGIRRFAAMNPYFASMGYCVTSG